MKLENLREGMRVKNYMVLCELLGEPVKGGNSKNAQLKEWKRYFDYEKVGYAFTIGKIHDVPPKKEPRQKKHDRSSYALMMRALILTHLSKCPENECCMTSEKWYSTLGMVSEDFYDEEKRTEYRDEYHPNTYSFNYISIMVSKQLHKVLQYALNDGLTYRSVWKLTTVDGAEREATDEEVSTIKGVYTFVMEEMGARSQFAISISDKRQEQFTRRTKQVLFEKYGWTSVWEELYVKADKKAAELYRNDSTEWTKEWVNAAICEDVLDGINRDIEKSEEDSMGAWDALDSDKAQKRVFQFPTFMASEAQRIIEQLVEL